MAYREWLWGLCKREFRKRLMIAQIDGELEYIDFCKLVLKTCQDVAKKHWRNVVHANRKYLLKYLPPDQRRQIPDQQQI